MSTVAKAQAVDMHVTRLFPVVYDFLTDSGDFSPAGRIGSKRYLVLQGGTRSSKTFSVLQAIAAASRTPAEQAAGTRYDIVRKERSRLVHTAMREFFDEVLSPLGWYDPKRHKKTIDTYEVGKTAIAFFGADDEKKLRGRKRDVIYINEANEITGDDFTQIRMRTSRKIIIDYNPDHITDWIEGILRDERTHFEPSTYLDNPYLPDELVEDIESLCPTYNIGGKLVKDWDLSLDIDQEPVTGDINAWRVYGLGEKGVSEATVYSSWAVVDDPPSYTEDEAFGLDFGYTNPTSLVWIAHRDVYLSRPELYVHELLYERQLTNSDLIERLRKLIPDDMRRTPIYCDSAEPQRIQELEDAGFHVMPADKSVTDGILTVKQHTILISSTSANVIREIRNYKYRTDRKGRILEEPVKFDDHTLDAIRYAAHTHIGLPRGFGGAMI